MSVEMKTLTIDGTKYEIVDETARVAAGKALIPLGDNPTDGVDNDTIDTWIGLGNGVAWISEDNQVNDQPSQYGFIINYVHDSDVFQIFHDQTSGDTYFRSGDDVNDWFQSWSRIPTLDGNGHINVNAVNTSESVTVSNGTTSMSIYVNGISDKDGNLWIDVNGEAYFKEVYANEKKLATEEYAMPAKTSGVTITTSTTLAADHAEKMLLVNSSSAVTITIPSGTTIPNGTLINIVAVGTGAVTLATASGVTLNTKDSKLKIDGQYAAVTLYKESSSVWHGWGALA